MRRRASKLRPDLYLLLVMLLLIGQVELAVGSSVDLVKNGGFESGLTNWNTLSLNQFSPAESLFGSDSLVKYSGSLSLRTVAITSFQFEIRGEVFQVIEDPNLSFDSTLSFWVYPLIVGDDMPNAHIWLYLVFHEASQKQYRVAYHVAWETSIWPGYRDWKTNTTDTTDFFLRTFRGEWNYVQRDLKRDYESRFGFTADTKLSKLEIHIATSTKQPIALRQPPEPFVWWDEIKLISIPPPKLNVSSLALYRLGTLTRDVVIGEEVELVASISNPADTSVRNLVAEVTYPNGVRPLSSPPTVSSVEPRSEARIVWRMVADEPGQYRINVKLSSSAGTYSEEVYLSARPKPLPVPQPQIEAPPQTATYLALLALIVAAIALGIIVSAKRPRKRKR